MVSNDINWIGGTPLGKIQDWTDSKTSTITPISFPGQAEGMTEGIDTLGIIAYFNISGRFTGKFRDIQSYVYQIKQIADGFQISSQLFKSPFVNTVDRYNHAKVGIISTTTGVTSSKLIDSTVTFITNGIIAGDKVKNLNTGEIANVTAIDSQNQLSISSNIFTEIGHTYAVTATMNVKVLSFEVRWELPGLSYCDYTLSVMAVKGV
jgi:hypothetical protein